MTSPRDEKGVGPSQYADSGRSAATPEHSYYGLVESIDSRGIIGWVFNTSNRHDPVTVGVYLDGVLIGEATTGISRADVAKEFDWPDSQAGFELLWEQTEIPEEILQRDPDQTVHMVFRVEETDYQLGYRHEQAPKARNILSWTRSSDATGVPLPIPPGGVKGLTTLTRLAARPHREVGAHAAVTIVSKNYFAFAKTLAETYKAQHPDHDFLIILVDKADYLIPETLPCGAEVIEIGELAIPDIERFIYRYSIMELNTAVKPFAIRDLFRRRPYQTIIYLDPDIWVFSPLTEVYSAFEEASILLIPHIRRPYFDDRSPSDLMILQSGTYNLGFIGLKRSDSSLRLLEWWMSKLYRDCVVDIGKGLFVDQKWIDLVPGFFPDHRIIYHPGYNVAYWNLHDRKLVEDRGQWKVDGEDIRFFHFSGYDPFAPLRLSKHQNRHDLEELPVLRALTDAYGERLFTNGYEESSTWSYAFSKLSNGVSLPLDLVRDLMQWATRAGIQTPSPFADPDGFCNFLMARNVLPDRPGMVLLYYFILQKRHDVASAFPKALADSDDEGFKKWLKTSGVKELGIGELLPFEQTGEVANYVVDAFRRLRANKRSDVFKQFEGMWTERAKFCRFANWFAERGRIEMGFSSRHKLSLERACGGLVKIINIYFLRGDLQVAFPVLTELARLKGFVDWLYDQRYQLDLTREEIALFSEFAAANPDLLEKLRFLYQHFGRKNKAQPTIYDVDARRFEIGSVLSTEEIRDWLVEDRSMAAADHFLAHQRSSAIAANDFRKYSVPGLEPRSNFAFVRRVRQELAEREHYGSPINFGGFIQAPTGMGESARSMRAQLRCGKIPFREIHLPHPAASSKWMPGRPFLFGWPCSDADLSITVANADSKGLLEAFLPASYWAKVNVGYWVWETEELPRRFKDAAELFDVVWTPSQYSADAIAKTVECPVHVLPHTVDFRLIDRARADRKKFGLPERGILFGFIFDPESVIERKNLRGLIEAFEQAFRKDDGCYLVLKVNGKAQGSYEYERIKAEIGSDRILLIEGRYSRQETFGFMKSLDVYASLHRAEGFGLTCAEAMALGLPVVATGYSGNLEYMDGENSLLVPARVIETDRNFGPYPVGTRWGDPDIEAAVACFRRLKEEALRREIGRVARESIRKKIGGEVLAQALLRTIEKTIGGPSLWRVGATPGGE